MNYPKSFSSVITDLEKKPGSWVKYALQFDSDPTNLGLIVGGEVFSYVLEGVTRYRFVPNPYISEFDAFYENFDGSAVSGLISARNDGNS